MKGVALPIETIIIISLAVIVLVALLFFFTGIFPPGAELVKLKQDQSIWCSSYHQNNPDCDEDVVVDTTIQDKIADICYKLNTKEGGYDKCEDPDVFVYECAIQCCRMFCGEPAESPATTTTT